MNRKSQDDEARNGQHTLSIERYFPFLLAMLKNTRMYASEQFLTFKIVFLTGLAVFFMVLIFVNLIADIGIIIVGVNADQFADVVSILSTHIVGLIKWLYCTTNNRKLFGITQKLERCHVLCQRIDSTVEEQEAYKDKIQSARRHCNVFFLWWLSMCNFAVLQWVVAPLLLGTYKIYLINDTFTERSLPYIEWFPLDTQNIFNYILLYMVEAVGMLSCIVSIYCFDSFYVTMLIITSAQLRHINTTLTKTHLLENKRTSEAVCILRKKLRNCVDCHVEIIEFLEKLQTFAGPIMFVQCVETIIVVCFLSFEASAIKLTMDQENMLVLFNLVGYFIAISVQLGFFCFFANQITHLTSLIPHSIYSYGWEVAIFDQKEESNTNKQLKYSDIHILVQMIMLQAQRPIILTGGPFYELSMETFRAIISLALSNSIMLRQLSN